MTCMLHRARGLVEIASSGVGRLVEIASSGVGGLGDFFVRSRETAWWRLLRQE